MTVQQDPPPFTGDKPTHPHPQLTLLALTIVTGAVIGFLTGDWSLIR